MNKIYKTIWNAARRSLVVVNESKVSTSHSSSTGGSQVEGTSPHNLQTFKRTLLSTCIALLPFTGLIVSSPATASDCLEANSLVCMARNGYTTTINSGWNDNGTTNLGGTTLVTGTGHLESTNILNVNDITVQGGTITTSGQVYFKKVDVQTGSTITVDGGTARFDQLTADGMTFNQTDGAVTISGGAVKGSTVTVTKGTLDTTAVQDLWENNNELTIGDAGATSQNNEHAVVKAHSITSGTAVTIKQGGTLEVDSITLYKPEETLSLEGGTLKTNLNQIFSAVEIEDLVLNANSQNPQITQGVASVGDVETSVINGTNFATGTGNIVFDDEYYSTETASQASTAFQTTFNNQNIAINMLGTSADRLTVDTVNKMITAGADNIVFHQSTLFNEAQSGPNNGKLTIGTGLAGQSNAYNGNFGFANLQDVTTVYINNDKHLTLVGYAPTGNFDWSDDKSLMHGVNGETNGTVYATESGHFSMGSNAGTATTGWVDTVFGTSATYDVTNGEFGVKKLSNLDASMTINADATLHIQNSMLQQNGELTNNGMIIGDDFRISGSLDHVAAYNNNGISQWQTVDLGEGATLNNVAGAQFIVSSDDEADTFTIDSGANVINLGLIDATDVKTTIVGLLQNGEAQTTRTPAGSIPPVAMFGDVTIEAGGAVRNFGSEIGQILTIAEEGRYANLGQTVWNHVTVNGGFANHNVASVATLTMNGDSLNALGGTLTIADGTFDRGTVGVGNNRDLSEDNKASLVINNASTLNAEFKVKNNGNLVFGTDRDFGPDLGLEALPAHPARVTVGKTVTTGATGSLTVGGDTTVNATAGNMLFAGNSTTIVDVGSLGNASAFATTVIGATVTIEDGAKLVLGNISQAGDYQITDGFDISANITDGVWTGGWADVSILPQNGSGLGWDLVFNQNNAGIFVSATLDNVETLYPNIVLSDMVNAYMKDPNNTAADVQFVNTALTDANFGVEEKTQLINTVMEMGLASSSLALAINDTTVVTNAVEQRASLMGDAWTGKGNGLWADILHSQQEVDGYKASGLSVGYDASSTGFVMGYDHRFSNNTTLVGAAISYQKGDSDSTGEVAKTTNDYDTFGIHGYVAYNPMSAFNLVGSMSYLRNGAEASTAIAMGSAKKAEADIDTDILTIGLRAETSLKVTDAVTVVPHAGVRVIRADTDAFDTKIDGAQGFKNDTDASTLVQFPVGVAVRMDKTMDNGWTMRPHADVTFVAQTGDTEQSFDVTGTTGLTGTVEGDVTGSFNTQVSFGFAAQKDNTTVGLRYGATMGGDGKRDHQLKAEVRFAF